MSGVFWADAMGEFDTRRAGATEGAVGRIEEPVCGIWSSELGSVLRNGAAGSPHGAGGDERVPGGEWIAAALESARSCGFGAWVGAESDTTANQTPASVMAARLTPTGRASRRVGAASARSSAPMS